jgi:hypothetical protein
MDLLVLKVELAVNKNLFIIYFRYIHKYYKKKKDEEIV